VNGILFSEGSSTNTEPYFKKEFSLAETLRLWKNFFQIEDVTSETATSSPLSKDVAEKCKDAGNIPK
jgi:hypothetical protein